MNNAVQSPCKMCVNRSAECHSSCMKYKIYDIYMKKKREERQRSINENADITLAKSAIKRKKRCGKW